MKVPAFIHLFASVYAATRCSVDFYAWEVVRRLLPQLYDRVMQDPANELRRIPIPRNPVNKGKLHTGLPKIRLGSRRSGCASTAAGATY
jgi:hypothetical protein